MGRAPCCEKIGLKKGPWSPEEDQVLVSYIQNNGHGNWRALPKKAGLLRCGKSCRLRWINYLSPEIKRGNFTKEEEDTIIQLHQMLGNRWSAIAARLPGRTDNEIKNVWHTHLKKRLPNYQPPKTSQSSPKPDLTTPQPASSDVSSLTDSLAMADTTAMTQDPTMDKLESVGSAAEFLQIDESFWTEVSCFPSVGSDEVLFESPISSVEDSGDVVCSSMMEDGMDFWYNLFITAGDLSELADF